LPCEVGATFIPAQSIGAIEEYFTRLEQEILAAPKPDDPDKRPKTAVYRVERKPRLH
jgi:hypothetical protein